MKVFATNSDVGSANMMIPALKALAAEGHRVTAFASEGTPAFSAFKNAGFNPETPGDRIKELSVDAMGSVLDQKTPDVVMVGVGTSDTGFEKLALAAAFWRGIKTVAVVEAWPHLWLANFGNRDTRLYLRADAVCVFDDISRRRFVEAGFRPQRVFVTGNPERDALAAFTSDRDSIRTAFRKEFGIAADAFVATYAVTNNLEAGKLDLDPDDPRWIGFGETETLVEFLGAMTRIESRRLAQAIVRIKPGRERPPLEALIRKHCPKTLLIGEECRDGRRVILGSDLVVGTTTIMLQEASFLGVLPVCFYPRLTRDDPQFANSLGIIKQIRGEGALAAFMREMADNPSCLDAELGKLERVAIPTDATARVVAVIKEIVS